MEPLEGAQWHSQRSLHSCLPPQLLPSILPQGLGKECDTSRTEGEREKVIERKERKESRRMYRRGKEGRREKEKKHGDYDNLKVSLRINMNET